MVYKVVIHSNKYDGINRHSFTYGIFKTKKDALKIANKVMKNSITYNNPLSYEILIE